MVSMHKLHKLSFDVYASANIGIPGIKKPALGPNADQLSKK